MIDFDVPANPGWGKSFLEKNKGAIDDDVQVVSPAFKRAIQKAQLRAQRIDIEPETLQEVGAANIADCDEVTVEHELAVV